MAEFDRRDLLAGLTLAGTALAATAGAASRAAAAGPRDLDFRTVKKDAELACVYHCDFGDPARIGLMLANIGNHLAIYDHDPKRLRIVVVANAAGVKPLLTDLGGTPWEMAPVPPDLFQRYQELGKHGVETLVCRFTLKRNNIDDALVRPDGFVKLVASGVATVAALQAQGFAYVKTG